MIDQSLICASALDVPPEFALEFDVQIVDPPYSRHVHKNAVSMSGRRGTRIRDLGFEHLSPALRTRIGQFAAKVKRWSLVYSDVENSAYIRIAGQAAGAEYIRTLPWLRWSMPQTSGDRPTTGLELVTLMHGRAPGRKHWNGLGSMTHLDHKAMRGEGKHKAQKPLDQALDLVSWFSDPGETILDCCAGRGTVGVACVLLGRGYVGLEIDPAEYARASARLELAKAGTFDISDQKYMDRWLAAQPEFEERKAKQRAEAIRAGEKARAVRDAQKAAKTPELGGLANKVVIPEDDWHAAETLGVDYGTRSMGLDE